MRCRRPTSTRSSSTASRSRSSVSRATRPSPSRCGTSEMPRRVFVLVAALALVATGCANLTVTQVTGDRSSVSGLRYALPKPFIQVVPQPDGSVAVDVIYLPDHQNVYAVDAWSLFGAYTFQVALDQNGGISKLEFKQNTALVAQQAAATAGAATAQAVSIRSAQAVAAQSAVDTAQREFDEARSTFDVADA